MYGQCVYCECVWSICVLKWGQPCGLSVYLDERDRKEHAFEFVCLFVFMCVRGCVRVEMERKCSYMNTYVCLCLVFVKSRGEKVI